MFERIGPRFAELEVVVLLLLLLFLVSDIFPLTETEPALVLVEAFTLIGGRVELLMLFEILFTLLEVEVVVVS